MSIFTKIKFMKPDEAVEYANNPDNAEEIQGLDETCRKMLQKKLTKKVMAGEAEENIAEIGPELNIAKKFGSTGYDQAEVEVFKPEPSNELLAKNTPKLQRFICNRFPDKWILQGNKSIRFKGGEFRTSDPELIEAIVNQPDFGLWIIADDPELMKRRKRMK